MCRLLAECSDSFDLKLDYSSFAFDLAASTASVAQRTSVGGIIKYLSRLQLLLPFTATWFAIVYYDVMVWIGVK